MANDIPAAPARFSSSADRRWCVAILLVATLVYSRDLSHSRGTAGDSFHHLINGIFIHDALREFPRFAAGPREFGDHYYSFFPAVNIGYYPPVFYGVEAAFMFVFGVSSFTGQLAVLFMVLLFAFFSYLWMRLRVPPAWAAAATLILISCPMLVLHGRDIMLEIPVLAFMMAAIYFFERLLQQPAPLWTTSLAWAISSALAIWTKQHAIVLLPVFGVTALLHFHRGLLRASVFTGALIILGAFAALATMTLILGGDAVGHSVGFTAQHVVDRFNAWQWTFYVEHLPGIVGWPLIVLAALGAVQVVRLRHARAQALPLIWIVAFYLMHSYFKAQEARYGCLWVPPFALLAVLGLRALPSSPPVGAWLTAGLVVWSVGQGYLSRVPRITDGFQLAAADLRDRMGPFSCLSFVPDKPGRLPVCFRLAIEDRPDPDRSIYSYGHILRAGQVWRARHEVWTDADAASDELRRWNVKYIVLTDPTPLEENTPDRAVSEMVRALLAADSFAEVRRYPLEYQTGIMRRRDLILYERKTPMKFNKDAQPRVLTGRLKVRVAASKPSP